MSHLQPVKLMTRFIVIGYVVDGQLYRTGNLGSQIFSDIYRQHSNSFVKHHPKPCRYLILHDLHDRYHVANMLDCVLDHESNVLPHIERSFDAQDAAVAYACLRDSCWAGDEERA